MRKTLIFLCHESDKLDTYLKEHDLDTEIHLYTDIKSDAGQLYECIREIHALFWENGKTDDFITDIPSLYQFIIECHSEWFGNIELWREGQIEIAPVQLELNEILMVESACIPDDTLIEKMCDLLDQLKSANRLSYSGIGTFVDVRYGELPVEVTRLFWISFAKLLIWGVATKQYMIHEYGYMYIVSLLMSECLELRYTKAYIRCLKNANGVTLDQKLFLINQISGNAFRNTVAVDEEVFATLNQLYEDIYHQWFDFLKDELVKIPYEERNHNRVVVLAVQFLSYDHAPTRSTIERCRALCDLGKDVYLINTAERYQVFADNYMPIYSQFVGSYADMYEQFGEIEIDDKKIWYRQLKDTMTVVQKVAVAMQWIKEIKPEYILCIGPDSLVADLCGNMIPCASMGVVFSNLPRTMNEMKILGRYLSEEENQRYQMEGKDVIGSRFTFELKKQKLTYTRQELGLPEDTFMLVVVGNRLHSEVNTEFLELLNEVCSDVCQVAFAGCFEDYETIVSAYTNVAKYGHFIGYCDDVIALMEICDLYVNPPRSGGGFSVVEAFYKEKPGVYLAVGDVNVAGGPEFVVSSLEEMKNQIQRYRMDSNYYAVMAKKAKQRADYMTSSLEAMRELDEAIRIRVQEKYW